MPSNKIHFTKALIKGLNTPPSKYIEFSDDTTRGLRIRVTTTGIKTFYVLRKFKGRAERILVGRFPETTVEAAKKIASQIHASMDAGINPNDSKRDFRSELTLDELFETYLTRHVMPHTRSPQETKDRYRLYIQKGLGSKRLSEINKERISKHQIKLSTNNTKLNANKMITLLRAMFNQAISWGLWQKENPTLGIKKFKETPRNRLVSQDELTLIFDSLKLETNPIIKDFFMISLLTGVRKTNILEMKWIDVNLDLGIWVIPMTKNGESQTIPLIPQSIAILKQRKLESKNEYVFYGTGKTGHMISPKKAWKRIIDRAKIKDLRIHDLRHAFGSYLAATGANQFVIRDAMGHKDIKTSSRYVQINNEVIRDSIQTSANLMLQNANELIPTDTINYD